MAPEWGFFSFLPMKNIELVAGWRTWWRQWSTWLAAAGAAIVSFTPELAEALQYVWLNLPMDIKATFSPEAIRYFGAILTILSIPAKLIRQRKLRREAIADERRRDTAHKAL